MKPLEIHEGNAKPGTRMQKSVEEAWRLPVGPYITILLLSLLLLLLSSFCIHYIVDSLHSYITSLQARMQRSLALARRSLRVCERVCVYIYIYIYRERER